MPKIRSKSRQIITFKLMDDNKLAKCIQESLVEYYLNNIPNFYAKGANIFNYFNSVENRLTNETKCYYLLGTFYSAYQDCFYFPNPMQSINEEEQFDIQTICYENAVYCFLKVITDKNLPKSPRYSAAMRLLIHLNFNEAQAFHLMRQYYATKTLGYNQPEDLKHNMDIDTINENIQNTLEQLCGSCYSFFNDPNEHVNLPNEDMKKLQFIVLKNGYSNIPTYDATNTFFAQVMILMTQFDPLLQFLEKWIIEKKCNGCFTNIYRRSIIPPTFEDFEKKSVEII